MIQEPGACISHASAVCTSEHGPMVMSHWRDAYDGESLNNWCVCGGSVRGDIPSMFPCRQRSGVGESSRVANASTCAP
eukprot:4987-Prymnesium_polylepis.1